MSGKGPDLLAGIHPVASALQLAPSRVRSLWLAEESRNSRIAELERVAREAGVATERRSRRELDQRSGGLRHQDVLAWFDGGNTYGEADIPGLLAAIDGAPLLLVLDGVQDPHNLGACLRSADAAGVHFVVVTRDRSSALTPVARRAAAGAAEAMPLVSVPNLARVLRQLKDAGVWLAGTSDSAKQSLYDADLRGPLALVMGGEGKGLRRLTQELCDYLVSLPMAGTVDSLNVSVATAVCLYEAVRQRITP